MATMTPRSIVHIDRDKCTGCGLCVSACHEGALQLVDGKAQLVRDDYCDGLGACIGECPHDAIRIEVREAAPFDAALVAAHAASAAPVPPVPACPSAQAPGTAVAGGGTPALSGCPSARQRILQPPATDPTAPPSASSLSNWPTQLKLVPVQAAVFQGADLLLSADCVPFAYAAFHADLLAGRVVLQACPKLDDAAFYRDKLTALLAANDIRSVTVARMEVPCCGGLTAIVCEALAASGKTVPLEVVTIGIEGTVLSRQSAGTPCQAGCGH